MTGAFRSWLPPNAAAPRAAVAVVRDAVEAWSREWFADAEVQAVGSFTRVADPRSELRKFTWHICDGGLAIVVSPGGLPDVGALILSVASERVDRTPADATLLDRLGTDCLDALKKRMAVVFGLDRGDGWSTADNSRAVGAVHRLAISAPGQSLTLAIELTEGLFARFVKTRLPPALEPGPLGKPATALAQLSVRVSAKIGNCAISISELSGLAPGDVLQLDRRLDGPVPLAVDEMPIGRGTGIVSRNDSGLILKLTQSPIG